MKTARVHDETSTTHSSLSSLTGSHRRTLEEIFRHPAIHNLEWRNVAALIADIGNVRELAGSEFVFEVAGERHSLRKAHTRDLTSSEVIEVRHFLQQAGFSPEPPSQPAAHSDPTERSFLIVLELHGTKIVDVGLSPEAPKYVIQHHDPHDHFLHHLVHEDQSREWGQRAPEEPPYYEEIANAIALGGTIVVIGHGTGKGDVAHHLLEYLKARHGETYRRFVYDVSADPFDKTAPQLLDLERQVLRS